MNVLCSEMDEDPEPTTTAFSEALIKLFLENHGLLESVLLNMALTKLFLENHGLLDSVLLNMLYAHVKSPKQATLLLHAP